MTESLSERRLRLPMYYELGEENIVQVTNCIAQYFGTPAGSCH